MNERIALAQETRPDQEVILDVQNLACIYKVGKGGLFNKSGKAAISDISFQIQVGESLGVVGESGSGKTTMLRSISQIVRPSHGRVLLEGRDLVTLNSRELRWARRGIGYIFQDPYSSLNPMWSVKRLIAEPLLIEKKQSSSEIEAKVSELMSVVGLSFQRDAQRRVREFSGGQVQRIAIARALASNPRLLICDEPVSALDVSIQAQILNLFEGLKEERQLSLLFVSHDLSVVEYISDRVAVIYGGRLCELADTKEIYSSALHPYTQALIDASPHRRRLGRRAVAQPISIDAAVGHERGCVYRDRCPLAQARCKEEAPTFRAVGPSHWVACHVQ